MSRHTLVAYWTQTEPPWDADVPWIVRVAVRWGITMVGFLAAEWIVTGVEIEGWEALLPAAAIFVFARALLRPLLIFLTCPLQLLTLGLFIFVVNAAVLAFTAWVSDLLGIGFEVDGFIAAFLGALVISAVSFALSRVLRRNPLTPRPD
ncbi:MAG: phage holin family protein [Dehalococcoidia bacterium]